MILSRTGAESQSALELTERHLEKLELELHSEKTALRTFEQGFQFLGATFLGSEILSLLDLSKPSRGRPALPPPLTLRRYLHLKGQVLACGDPGFDDRAPGALRTYLEEMALLKSFERGRF